MTYRLRYEAAAIAATLLLAAACSGDPEQQARKYVASGDAYVAKNSRDEAIIQYRNAIKARPQWAEAHYKLAQTYQAALKDAGIPTHTTLGTDDIHAEFARLTKLGVVFTMEPTKVDAATAAVFDDTCGNLISLAQVD